METPRNSDNYDISIHALRKESDGETDEHSRDGDKFQSTLSVRRATRDGNDELGIGFISIHALRKESDVCDRIVNGLTVVFQSTLSVRRATRPSGVCRFSPNFNPRSP